ncbi:SEC-C domain-containing protein [Nonomuraea sp. NPDC050404]|uniref:SEC-C domain-containing protein n=1 Tax=Nonomuraea sp. NPDC050404 TaxID=3155783 RepID=UPI003403D5C9
MTSDNLVSQADIDSLGMGRFSGPERDAAVARVLAAVDDPALRGEDFDRPYALMVACDFLAMDGEVDRATELLRRADTEDIRREGMEPLSRLAALLHEQGRTEEASAIFRRVVKEGLADWTDYDLYADALGESGDQVGALRILVGGQERLTRRGNALSAAQLQRSIDRFRRDMGFPDAPAAPDPDAHWHEEEGDPRTLFWPREDFDRLSRRWPRIAEKYGTDWDNHRSRVELAGLELAGEGSKLHLLYADFTAFAQLMIQRPDLADPIDEYFEDPALDTTDSPWRTERNAPCWCRSGRKYKQCCRRLGMGSQ